MKNSHIEWTDHTFNPWVGCTKVSPGCANCYAEARDQRFAEGKHWGEGAPRQRTSAANWKQPLKWDRDAKESYATYLQAEDGWRKQGVEYHRPRVFCASLADWLDDEVPIEWLADLLYLISQCHNLDWLLLTKRPENFLSRLKSAAEVKIAWSGSEGIAAGEAAKGLLYNVKNGLLLPSNIWIGTTVEDQQRADERIPLLLSIPAKVRFLSCEPLLGPINFLNAQCGYNKDGYRLSLKTNARFADWVICGGESGPKGRPMHPDWARSLRDQCQNAGVPFFFKQWGEWEPLGRKEDLLDSEIMRAKDPSLRWLNLAGGHGFHGEAVCLTERVGKQKAGRQLDGREWSEFPKVEVSA